MANSQLQEVKDILREKKFGKLFSGDTENTYIQFFQETPPNFFRTICYDIEKFRLVAAI